MSLREYAWMLSDPIRIQSFKRAIEKAVRPGDVVVEIGAGLGTFSFFACQAGASQVYAIEDRAFDALKSLAHGQKFSENLQVIQGKSLEVSLPERADLIIYEDFNSAFLGDGLCATVKDATKRFLKPEGRWLPDEGMICGALIEAEETWKKLAGWRNEIKHLDGLNFQKLSGWLLNDSIRRAYSDQSLLTTPQELRRYRLGDPNEKFELKWEIEENANRDGVVHGLCVWFGLNLAEGIRLNNAPGADQTVYRQELFPLSVPIAVRHGETLRWSLYNIPERGGEKVWWQWRVETDEATSEGSTFAGFPLSIEDLKRKDQDHIPQPTQPKKMAQFLFGMVDGKRSQGEMAEKICSEFPGVFQSKRDALGYVVRILEE